jgi:site-specific recombinase XerD
MMKRHSHRGDCVFGKTPESVRKRMRADFHRARVHMGIKTANKELLKIHLHTFRHFYATKLYLQTRDIR